jgi:uncharacterized protein YqiB (DUF1249 family)
MLNDVLVPVSWRAKPRSFVALMSVYESNYIRLRALAGNPAALAGSRRSLVAGDCELVLDVVEQSRYTTTLQLTYLLPSGQGAPERYPDLRLRVYCDARLAEAQLPAAWPPAGHEVAALAAHPVLGALRRGPERELDQRWALNMMLNKWLEYCLERGHRFY